MQTFLSFPVLQWVLLCVRLCYHLYNPIYLICWGAVASCFTSLNLQLLFCKTGPRLLEDYVNNNNNKQWLAFTGPFLCLMCSISIVSFSDPSHFLWEVMLMKCPFTHREEGELHGSGYPAWGLGHSLFPSHMWLWVSHSHSFQSQFPQL